MLHLNLFVGYLLLGATFLIFNQYLFISSPVVAPLVVLSLLALILLFVWIRYGLSPRYPRRSGVFALGHVLLAVGNLSFVATIAFIYVTERLQPGSSVGTGWFLLAPLLLGTPLILAGAVMINAQRA
jgi:hypothetical protein